MRGSSDMSYVNIIKLFFLASLMATSSLAEGQDNAGNFTLGGYLSSVNTSMFEKPKSDWYNDYLIHNRVNIGLAAGSKFSVALELRNRFFSGDMVRMTPGFDISTGFDKGLIDMSWNIASGGSYLLNVTADRAWVDYNSGKLQVRVGRQRINWGQALVWNPNDIFNVYSFFDFDYDERPGSDAVRVQYYTSTSSSLEIAVKADHDRKVTGAVRGLFSAGGWDMQLLAGIYEEDDLTLGAGWSGSVGSYSVRGEATWFHPMNTASDETVIATTGVDRFFENSSMVQFQVMYSNNPLDITDFAVLYGGDLSTKQLAFSEWSFFGQYGYPVTPLLNITLSGIYYPGFDGFFAGPSLAWSMSQNVDFTFMLQHFEGSPGSQFLQLNIGFLRFRQSF